MRRRLTWTPALLLCATAGCLGPGIPGAPAPASLGIPAFEVLHTHCGPPVEYRVEIANTGPGASADVTVRFWSVTAGVEGNSTFDHAVVALAADAHTNVTRILQVEDRCAAHEAYYASADVASAGRHATTQRRLDF